MTAGGTFTAAVDSPHRPSSASTFRPRITLRGVVLTFLIALWALWFGGTMATFVFAGYFFYALPHEAAIQSVNAMFHGFADYELAIAAIMILITGSGLVAAPSRKLILILGVLILTGGMAVTFGLGLMPAMDKLRHDGLNHTIGFDKLHHKSVVTMNIQAGLLVILGTMLVLAARDRMESESTGESSALHEHHTGLNVIGGKTVPDASALVTPFDPRA